MVKSWWESSYIGDNIYNETGVGQYVLQFADQNQWAVYHVKIENDGDETSIFKLVASETGTGTWTSRYYDALSGGNDITTQIKSSSGWSITLDPGNYREIRVEVKPGSSMQGLIRRVVLTTTSSSPFATKTDVNMMDTQCGNLQPDNLIKISSEPSYIGNNIYNTNGQGQTKSQDISKNCTAKYHIKVENDGEVWNDVLVNGPGGDSYWDVKYYDAFTGGTNITESVINGTYLIILMNHGDTAHIRIEVKSYFSTPYGSQKIVILTSTAGFDANKKDAVKAITNCVSGIPTPPRIRITEGNSEIPMHYFLDQTIPNPVIKDGGILIRYGLPQASPVDIIIYNIAGQAIREFDQNLQTPGCYTIKWDLKDRLENSVGSGVYFCRLKMGNWIQIRKILVEKQ